MVDRGTISLMRHLAILATAFVLPVGPAHAHPMGNFAICHYTRLQAEGDGLRIRYVLDLAEIPTFGEKDLLDQNGDGTVSPEEKQAYLAAKQPELLAGLTLRVDGKAVPIQYVAGEVRLSPGAGGLDTLLIILDCQAPLAVSATPMAVHFRDRTYEARSGWKEIVAVAGRGAVLLDSSVPSTDRSQELQAYPPDAIPPQDLEARFTIRAGETTGSVVPAAEPGDARPTPGDAFTQTITQGELTAGLVLAGLAIAFGFGALHALSPGHGKAMVAAYLMGNRGTARDAALLGLVVTVTHTLGVFLLGLVALVAARFLVPEKLYSILTAVSGLAVCGVGGWLFYRRVRRWVRQRRLRHAPPVAKPATHGHPHGLPDGPVTARALITLGISGGLVPCPSALVVLLSAVALHRVGYGLALITAFSFGLAAVLIAIGLLVVHSRDWLERLPASGALLRRLPVASAAVITLIGATLVVRAFADNSP